MAEIEIQLVCVPGHGIEEPVYVLCCQSNEPLEKTEVGPYHKHEYIWMNDWKEWSFIRAFWVYGYPRSSDRESWPCHPEKGWLSVWVSDTSVNTASVANTWVNCPYVHVLPVRTDLCCCVMANLSSDMRLLLKYDINK